MESEKDYQQQINSCRQETAQAKGELESLIENGEPLSSPRVVALARKLSALDLRLVKLDQEYSVGTSALNAMP